ncbi:ankyrin repeat-containing protein BDA1 isoform X1 [Eucalyptus grandis]|uniref:ankyrin repeat-containing protein BDA1 isoform X1 n=1 Tax=Eucalyptus grandis TaxID=71139 RepID=UPI00052715AE|nr:ankyrin repeat-containing protein BDA1 isoform X1 [Eucalyptus grandis]
MARGLLEKEEKEARESQLHQAIANDDVDELHYLIVEERGLLDRVSKHPFPNTPLHLAAAAGKTQVAMELAILRPSLAQKLNPEGYSPIHLALQQEQYQTVRALMNFNPKLIRVYGRGGITPLHYVAEKEGDKELELLAEILYACKSSIEDLTSRCETAVHVAVKNHNLKAFKVLFGWLKRVHLTEILNWKDQDDNTVMHISVSGEPQKEIILALHAHVDLDVKNFQGKTAQEILQDSGKSAGIEGLIGKWTVENFKINVKKTAMKIFRNGREGRPPTPALSLSELLSMELTIFERLASLFIVRDESARNIVLAVATLIATATYQAALSPPGGYWEDNSPNHPAKSTVVTANSSAIAVEKPHEAGNSILTGSKLYWFMVLNSTVFMASLITIWITAIPLVAHTRTVHLLTFLIAYAFFVTLRIELPKPDRVAGAAIYLSYLLPTFAFAYYFLMKYSTYPRQLKKFATGRRVGNFLKLKDRK